MYHHLIGQLGTTVGSHEGEVSYDWPQHGGHLHGDLSVPRHNHSTGTWCKWDCNMTESDKILNECMEIKITFIFIREYVRYFPKSVIWIWLVLYKIVLTANVQYAQLEFSKHIWIEAINPYNVVKLPALRKLTQQTCATLKHRKKILLLLVTDLIR